MDDLERLKLLLRTLSSSNIGTTESLGVLANEIESIRSMLENVSEAFVISFSRLWEALEIVAVAHQEQGTELTEYELIDLVTMKKDLEKQTEQEIAYRIG